MARARGDRVHQRTVADTAFCSGRGLHGGMPVRLTLKPACEDSGIVFVRTDLDLPVEIPARAASVGFTRLATTLRCGKVSVGTVEHLMAALFGLGIHNVRAEVDGPELPVMDGSAAPFVQLIHSVGVSQQREPCHELRFRRRIELRDGDCVISIEPSPQFRVSYAIEFEHPAIRRQSLSIDSLNPGYFEREIAGARTFGFLREVDELRRAGFARGGSLENSVVLNDERVLNPEGLRWPDEFVRHKVLDLCGDLALLGSPVAGHVRVERGGHSLHQKLVSAILSSPDVWRSDQPARGPADSSDLARFDQIPGTPAS
jgi:UDP-3-O-[3-hydroxymyristoyl] N-acetylglucosamine deacetylase